MANVFRDVKGMEIFRDSVYDYADEIKRDNERLAQIIATIQQGSPDDDECQKAVKDIIQLTEELTKVVKFFEDVGSHYEERIKKIIKGLGGI